MGFVGRAQLHVPPVVRGAYFKGLDWTECFPIFSFMWLFQAVDVDPMLSTPPYPLHTVLRDAVVTACFHLE